MLVIASVERLDRSRLGRGERDLFDIERQVGPLAPGDSLARVPELRIVDSGTSIAIADPGRVERAREKVVVRDAQAREHALAHGGGGRETGEVDEDKRVEVGRGRAERAVRERLRSSHVAAAAAAVRMFGSCCCVAGATAPIGRLLRVVMPSMMSAICASPRECASCSSCCARWRAVPSPRRRG